MAALPEPGLEAQAHSRALAYIIVRRIAEAGGWLSFADYMSLALYAPGLGYYTAGARKFGAGGDFVTAPELTPIFGQAIAAQAAQVLAETSGGDILELGAGSGRLAVDMLAELERLDSLPGRYCILDVSPDLRQRQLALIQSEIPRLADRVHWLNSLPECFVGLIVGNEVLDALPVHLVRRQGDAFFERGVVVADDARFEWQDRPLTDGQLYRAAQALPAGNAAYLSEINLAAPALVHSLAASLERGMILLIDYGFPKAEYYHPDRNTGTLMCHYRHHAFDDPFFLPGLTDITSHVDFTAVADAALESEMDVLGYTGQAHFLVNCGALACLGRDDPGSVAYLRQAAAVQKLVQPSEMGELFKAIALGKDLEQLPLGFSLGDKRHTL